MPRDLFGDVTSPSITLGSRKWYTVPLSLAAHTAILVPIVLVPLLATDVLPSPRELMTVAIVDPPAPPEPPAPRQIEKPRPAQNPDAAPLVAPDKITPEPPGFEPVDAVAGVPEGLVSGAEIVIEPPPPPPPAQQVPREPVRVGGLIRMPTKIRDALPVYPNMARIARVEGTVILEAIISVDGKVQNLRVLRSYPLLDQAAIDAVKQWEYTPSTLNGVPVPVIMTVTVTFTLNKD